MIRDMWAVYREHGKIVMGLEFRVADVEAHLEPYVDALGSVFGLAYRMAPFGN